MGKVTPLGTVIEVSLPCSPYFETFMLSILAIAIRSANVSVICAIRLIIFPILLAFLDHDGG